MTINLTFVCLVNRSDIDKIIGVTEIKHFILTFVNLDNFCYN